MAGTVHTEASIFIDRPIEEVFAFATDQSSVTRWRRGPREAGLTGSGVMGVGARYAYLVRFGGSTMDLAGEVTDWQPPKSFGWRATHPPFPVSGGLTCTPARGGTLVTTYSDSQPARAMRLFRPILVWIGQRQYRQELATLKELIESGG